MKIILEISLKSILTLITVCHFLSHSFDIDEDALEICRSNVDEFDLTDTELIAIDLLDDSEMSAHSGKFDTVLLNPPFGTKNNQGTDLAFLKVCSVSAMLSALKFASHLYCACDINITSNSNLSI